MIKMQKIKSPDKSQMARHEKAESVWNRIWNEFRVINNAKSARNPFKCQRTKTQEQSLFYTNSSFQHLAAYSGGGIHVALSVRID